MNRLLFVFLLCNYLNTYSQSQERKDSIVIVLKKNRNVFYEGDNKLSKKEILTISSNHYLLKPFNKNVQDFYRFKENKNGYGIATLSSLLVGSSTVYLVYTQGAIESEMPLLSVFGGASIGFATGWMINKIKFYKNKRKIIKALS